VNTFMADTSGNVAIVGELTTSSEGRRIRVNPSGGEGQIRFYSSDNADFSLIDTASYFGGSESGIRIRTSLDANDNFFASLYSQGHVRTGYLNSSYGACGGLFYADRTQAILGNFPDDILDSGLIAFTGAFYAGHWLDNSQLLSGFQAFDSGGTNIARVAAWNDTGTTVMAGAIFGEDRYIYLTGRFRDCTATLMAEDDLFMPGAFAATANTTFTMTYGPTMLVAPRPFYYVRNSSATNFSHKLTSYSTTAFSLQISTSLAIEIGWLSTVIVN
jgi:hypothetical protein